MSKLEVLDLADSPFLKRGRAYLASTDPFDTPLSGREIYGCNCYASGESFYTECIMQNIHKPVLDFFQLVAEVPGYEEMETLVGPAEDVQELEEIVEVEQVAEVKETEVKASDDGA